MYSAFPSFSAFRRPPPPTSNRPVTGFTEDMAKVNIYDDRNETKRSTHCHSRFKKFDWEEYGYRPERVHCGFVRFGGTLPFLAAAVSSASFKKIPRCRPQMLLPASYRPLRATLHGRQLSSRLVPFNAATCSFNPPTP
jgi:hypothetical protein